MTGFVNIPKGLLSDGIAERQILLLKLVHEYDNAPPFGELNQADADSQPRRWIARVTALMSRVSISHGIAVKGITGSCHQYWSLARDSYRLKVLEAIEELKLELELEGREEIGTVYAAGKEYDFFTDLKGIVSSASSDVFIVDAYFDGATFDTYFRGTDSIGSVRILCGQYAQDLMTHAEKYEAQTRVPVQVKKTKSVHDRLVFIDGTDCWLIGASIKDAGKKPTYLIPLIPQLAPEKRRIYEEIWSASQTYKAPQ